MLDYIIHLEQALLLPLTQQDHHSLSLTLSASLHHQSNPCESLQANSIMANLHITKDESLKASLEAHDIIGSSQRFSLWAGTQA